MCTHHIVGLSFERPGNALLVQEVVRLPYGDAVAVVLTVLQVLGKGENVYSAKYTKYNISMLYSIKPQIDFYRVAIC